MGVFGIAGMVAPAIGPTLGGIIVDVLNWQWIFIINIPIGMIAIFMTFLLLEETPRRTDIRPDIPGIILCSLACFSLLLALSQGQKEGWESLYIVNLLIISGFSWVLFFIWETISPEPLLNMRLLNNRVLVTSLLALSFLTIGIFAGMFLIPIYAQNLLGLTPTQTGIMLLPQALAMAAMMPVGGMLYDKLGARPLCLLGIVITAYYTFQLHTLTAGTSFTDLVWLLSKRSIGMGLAMGPLMTVGMNTIPKHLTSQGSAFSNLFRQISGAIGIPILVSVMTNRQIVHSAWLADTVTWSSPVAVSTIKKLAGVFKIYGIKIQAPYTSGAALSILSTLKSKEAFICGIQDAFIVAAVITAFAVPLTFFLSRKAEKEETSKQKSRFPEAVVSENEG